MPWMMTGTAGSNSELSTAHALCIEGCQCEFDGAVEVRLDGHASIGRTQDTDGIFKIAPDQPRDDRNAEFGHLRGRLNQQTGKFRQVSDAGEYVDQYDTHVWPRHDPTHHRNQPRWIATELTGTDVAEIDGATPLRLEFVHELHAQARARGDEPDLTIGIDFDIVEAVCKFACALGINIRILLQQSLRCRLTHDGVVVDNHLDVAGDPTAVRQDEQRVDFEQYCFARNENFGKPLRRIAQGRAKRGRKRSTKLQRGISQVLRMCKHRM